MALTTLSKGPFPFSFLGKQDLALSSLSVYTSEFFDRVFAISSSGNYTSGQPGVSLGVTKLTAQGSNASPYGYIFLLKKAVQLDLALLGLVAATTTSGGSDTYSFTGGTSDPVVTSFAPATETVKRTYSAPTYSATGATLEVSINGGAYTDPVSANAQVPVSGSYAAQFRLTRTSAATSITATLTATY